MSDETPFDSFFDDLVGASEVGEEIIDPRVGAYESAMLSTVSLVTSSSMTSLLLTWSGLTDKEGRPFEQFDRLFFPRKEDFPATKGAFMTKLKALEIVPLSFNKILYLDTEGAQEKLLSAIQTKVGEVFTIRIYKDKRDYYKVAVNRRPAPSKPF